MVLIYTDRPATEYWNLYVVDKENHDRPEIDKNPELKEQFARFLAEDVQRTVQRDVQRDITPYEIFLRFLGLIGDVASLINKDEIADNVKTVVDLLRLIERTIEDSIITYGIRDWSRPPYGAANHSWKPGVKSWEVQDQLQAPRRAGTQCPIHC